MFVLGQLLVQLSGKELGADCNPAHHCDLDVYERILPGLVSLVVIIDVTLHIIFLANYLPYWYNPCL